jgi:hypothetical protein
VNQKTFVKEYTVNEEQIDIFKILNGSLYIPGHDSRESWDYGNFYKHTQDGWVKKRNIPDGIHVYDMAYSNGKLFAALGNQSGQAQICVSSDMGETWDKCYYRDNIMLGHRQYRIFTFKGEVYSIGLIFNMNSSYADRYTLLKYDGEQFVDCMANRHLVPNLSGTTFAKMVRITEASDHLFYIGGEMYNDHQTLPKALYVASEINTPQKITFDTPEAIPMDILVRDETVYVLTYTKTNTNQYKNTIYRSDNYSTWTEFLSHTSSAFARSFEELNGDLYLGLGSNLEDVSASTGKIVRITNVF